MLAFVVTFLKLQRTTKHNKTEPMKLSKLDIIKLIYSEYINQPIFIQLQARFNRMPEFEFIRLAELTLNQKLTICRKNTYLIG